MKCLLLLLLLHSHPPTQGCRLKILKIKRAKFLFTGRLRRSDDEALDIK